LYNDYDEFFYTVNSIVKLNWCKDLWSKWRTANATYIDPIKDAKSVLNYVKMQCSSDLTHITDIWTQAVVYYYIWLEFGIEVPHNDYANWFTNTNDIVIMLDKHGVKI
jgi:hypothetical protein